MDKPIEQVSPSHDLAESLGDTAIGRSHDFVAYSSSEDGVRLITLRGELDLASAPKLERELEAALAASEAPIIVDLSDLAFMDSTGLRALIMGQRNASDQQRPFAVARRADSFVARVFEIAGADRAFDLHDSRDAALESVQG